MSTINAEPVGQTATEQAATEQAATEQAATEQAATEQAATEQAATEQPVEATATVRVRNKTKNIVAGIEPDAEGEVSFAEWTVLGIDYLEKV